MALRKQETDSELEIRLRIDEYNDGEPVRNRQLLSRVLFWVAIVATGYAVYKGWIKGFPLW